MELFASFNGGPSDQAILYGLLGGVLSGAILGGVAGFTGKRIMCGCCFLAATSAMLVAGLIIIGGKQPGDAADFFLIGALAIFLPLAGVLGVVAYIITAPVIRVFGGSRIRTELYWIDGPWPGKLAILPRPRGGDWLEVELSNWRRLGLDAMVSALTSAENAELDLIQEKEQCENAGIQFLAFPIADRGTPDSAEATRELVVRLQHELALGKKIAIHCWQGVGRAALLAACVLAVSGVDPASAWERIALARGCAVPDTNEQRDWVVRFSRDMLASVPAGKSATGNAATPMHSGGE